MAEANSGLSDLLAEPSERLDVELKEWLDLSINDHKALLAKEIIGLANHGGGYLIVGFREQADGSFTPASPRPPTLNAWSQDAIQSIISKYIDPTVQCRMVHQAAGTSPDRYPIIIVPGGHRVPIRAKSGSPDGKLVPHRVYIRRPGPASEEPKTADEWGQLFERILQNRKEELLSAMRSIIAGEIPTARPTEPSRLDELKAFERTAIERWNGRVEDLDPSEPPRFPHGHYDVGIAIDGVLSMKSLAELREIMRREVRNHSGWPPFVTIDRPPFSPKPIESAVEFWRGPDSDGSCGAPAHHDFWRAAPSGLFFTRTGYREDGGDAGLPPGKYFHLTTSTWRIGEAILEGAYIARALDAADANLIVHCRWEGLAGRKLFARGSNRILTGEYVAGQNTFDATQTVAVSEIPTALPEVVHALLKPLYELFDFFPLPKRLVEEELATLQRHRF